MADHFWSERDNALFKCVTLALYKVVQIVSVFN